MFDVADIEAFVKGILEEKQYTSFSEDELNKARVDLMSRFMEQLEIELISELSEEKADELANKMEEQDLSDEEIGNFLRENGVNIEEITSKAKNEFKQIFLGNNETAAAETEGEN
jgi:hypothetical protein